MNIEQELFRDEAYRGEKLSLKFRWLLIAVVLAFILITFIKGDKKEAFLAFIPAGIFLIYNIYLGYLLKRGRNFYFLRYFSVTIDILSLSVHIYINSRFFSPIAVSTTASIFIYPVLMFLSVLRYDKKLIIYATALTIIAFNVNYIIRYPEISPELIKKVISSDPMGQLYKSAYIVLLGVFFLNIPDMVLRYIERQKNVLYERNEYNLKLLLEKKEKELIQNNFEELNTLHNQLQEKSCEIEAQNKKLNELISTKNKLISFISHDIKNSFSAMSSIINSTKSGIDSMDNSEVKQAMNVLYKHSSNNQKLFENLLQWAKLQSNQINVNIHKTSLNELCHFATENHQSHFELKNLHFELNIEPETVILADKILLESILNNLIGNAIKYTPKGGKIILKTITKEKNVVLKIKDTGIGIDKKRLENIFDVTDAKSTNGTEGEKGSGFGLILCKELVEKMNGKINVKSRVGEGTCFFIELARAN